MQKFEGNEKKLKNMLVEKENQFEEEKIEMKRLINAEKKRHQGGDKELRDKEEKLSMLT